jgi:hypothetical protein
MVRRKVLGILKADGNPVALVAINGSLKWEFSANPTAKMYMDTNCISFTPPDSPGYLSWNIGIEWLVRQGFELTDINHPPRDHEAWSSPMSDKFLMDPEGIKFDGPLNDPDKVEEIHRKILVGAYAYALRLQALKEAAAKAEAASMTEPSNCGTKSDGNMKDNTCDKGDGIRSSDDADPFRSAFDNYTLDPVKKAAKPKAMMPPAPKPNATKPPEPVVPPKIVFGTLKANGEQVALVAKGGDHKWEFPANPEIEKILNATCISFSPPDSPGYPSWFDGVDWFNTHGFELTEIKHPPRDHEAMSDEFIKRTGMIP